MLTVIRAFTTQTPVFWIMENQPAKCQNPILLLATVTVSTALTLLFLPALYVAWFGLAEPPEAPQSPAIEHEPLHAAGS